MARRGLTITKAIKAERRTRAEKMKADYDLLTLEEKIARLPPDGAKKQRARLLAQLEEKNKKQNSSEKKEDKASKSNPQK
jgi:hypothetical protein